MKSFKNFLIERRPFFAVANDYIQRKRDKDKEDTGYDPSAEGEDNFQDFHWDNKQLHNHPEADDNQFSDKGRSKTQHQPSNGDREPIQQGTSKVDVAYKTKFNGSANKGQSGGKHTAETGKDADKSGEKELKKLKGYPVQVKEEANLIGEAVIDKLHEIAANQEADAITFQNGKQYNVDPITASKLVETYEKLSPSNQEKFALTASKDTISFIKMVSFSK